MDFWLANAGLYWVLWPEHRKLESWGSDSQSHDAHESNQHWQPGSLIWYHHFIRAMKRPIILILIGGQKDERGYNYDNTILEYDITGNSWTQIGTMTQARAGHAISVVKYKDYSGWCQWKLRTLQWQQNRKIIVSTYSKNMKLNNVGNIFCFIPIYYTFIYVSLLHMRGFVMSLHLLSSPKYCIGPKRNKKFQKILLYSHS